jgi:hypothetical protein
MCIGICEIKINFGFIPGSLPKIYHYVDETIPESKTLLVSTICDKGYSVCIIFIIPHL